MVCLLGRHSLNQRECDDEHYDREDSDDHFRCRWTLTLKRKDVINAYLHTCSTFFYLKKKIMTIEHVKGHAAGGKSFLSTLSIIFHPHESE